MARRRGSMAQTGGSLKLDEKLRAYALPWEGIGHTVPKQITGTNISKVRTATGLDWEPCEEPQYRRTLIAGRQGHPDAVYDYSEPMVATSIGAQRAQFKYITKGPGGPILDSANGTYHMFSNREMFEVAEAIGLAGVEMGREISFVAGGEIDGGRKVFLLADLGVTEIPGDPSPHVKYMGFLNGHDGTAALKVIGTDTRWFCCNQIHAAEVDAKALGTAYSFRHTSRIGDRVGSAVQAITATMYQLDTVEKATRELLKIKITPKQAQQYTREYAYTRVASKSAANPDTADGSQQRDRALAAITGGIQFILESPTCDGIRDTAYGLFAATVEFVDHKRDAKTKSALFTRTMIDTQRDKKLARKVLFSVV